MITAPVWDQFDELEQVTGRKLVGRGPDDPEDDLWLQHKRGEITFIEYWEQYAERNGFADWRDLFRQLGTHLPHRFGDPDAYALMADARAAGYKVGVLTNDGVAINGTDFFAGIPEFQQLDAFVDARAKGFAKPDPEPYLRAAEELDVAPDAGRVPRRHPSLHRRCRAGGHDRGARQPDRQARRRSRGLARCSACQQTMDS